MKQKFSRADMAAYILGPMPESIKDVLLRDGGFSRDVGFTPAFSTQLTDSLAVLTDSFVSALRAALAGRIRFNLKLAKDKVASAKLSRRKGGLVSVAVQGHVITVNDADAVAAEKRTRTRALDRIFGDRPLLEDEETQWRNICASRAFTDEEYIRLMSDASDTPEAVRRRLERPQTLTIDSLVPKERKYYERLVGDYGGEAKLNDYIASSLARWQRWMLSEHRSAGLRRIAYSALLHQLVPLDVIGDVAEEELNTVLKADDPFSLLFVFEVACAAVVKDSRFIKIGTDALNRLFGDETKAEARCTVFCAAAVAATIKLRLVFEEGSVPLFWFRLAALSHAGIVADALGRLSTVDKFLKWVNQQAGPEYVWQTVIDRRDAPRWEPDWINPDQLYAELLGRCAGAIQLLAEDSRPCEWLEIVEGRIREREKENRAVTSIFPGPLEDFIELERRPRNEALIGIEERIKSAGTIGETTGLTGLAYLDLPSAELAPALVRIIESARSAQSELIDIRVPFLHICARVAAMLRSLPLSSAVIDECVRLCREGASLDRSIDLLQVAVAACGAESNHDGHRALVGNVATRFAYVLSGRSDASAQLVGVFDVLSRRDSKLMASLGRAVAVNEAAVLRQ